MIIIDANYGEKRGDSISIRVGEKTKISSPIDLISAEDYYYNISENKLFYKDKEISPIAFINAIYNEHIKPTKPLRGLMLRTKLFFWRFLMRKFFRSLSDLFNVLLYILTGDRYAYEPVLQEEILNDKILNHRFKELIGKTKQWRGGTLTSTPSIDGKDNSKKAVKFKFLDYEASYWVIISYSIINLAIYLFFELNNWRPPIIVTMLKNNFLTLIYVVVSLWLMEVIIPRILKGLIKYNAILSFKSASKRIKI